MGAMQKVKIVAGVAAVVVIALFLHYNLPRTAVVQITGTDVKRADSAGTGGVTPQTGDPGKGPLVRTHDVRFINALSRDGKIMVFRNEDTGWGWPPYFKFDSADLTAQAQSFATDPAKPFVRITYYGWRVRIFSMFPNAVSLKTVEKDYTHYPVFNVVFIIALLISGALAYRKLRLFFNRNRIP